MTKHRTAKHTTCKWTEHYWVTKHFANGTGRQVMMCTTCEKHATIAQIERAVGKKLPRVTLEGFDYKARPQGALEIPIGDRIAAIQDEAWQKAASGRGA